MRTALTVVVVAILCAGVSAQKKPVPIDWDHPQNGTPVSGEKSSSNGTQGRAIAWGDVKPSGYAYRPDPPCNGNIQAVRSSFEEGIKGAAAMLGSLAGPWGTFAGAITGSAIVMIGELPSSEGSDLHKFLTGGQSYSRCDIIGVVIPNNAEIIGVTYWVNPLLNKTYVDKVGPDMDLEYAKWEKHQVKTIDSNRKLISAVFKNWSKDHPRVPALVVGYHLPEPADKK